MDKPTKPKITIKINGENKSFSEENKKIYPEIAEEVIYVDEPDRGPQFIEQETHRETAATQSVADEDFDWIIPDNDEDDIAEYKIVSHQVHAPATKKTTRNLIGGIGPILLSGVFAILLGTTLGILMLKLVISDGSKPAIAEPKTVAETKETSKTSDKTFTAVIPALSTIIVQEGFYSSKDAAKTAAGQVASIGVPAEPINIGGKDYVYIGVAESGAIGKQLGSLYKAKGVRDFFAKEITIEEKKMSGVTEADKAFLESAFDIYQNLVKITSDAIVTNTLANGTNAKISEQLNGKGLKNDTVKKLHAELSAAYQNAIEAKKMEEAQQHLLNFLALYNSL